MQQEKIVWLVSIVIFATWLFALLLLVLNMPLIRLLEGYYLPQRNPLSHIQRRRFRHVLNEIAVIEGQYRNEMSRGCVSTGVQKKYGNLLYKRYLYFPPEEHHILPTRFGNTISSFEQYSREMYGLDAIPGWPRILALVPDNYRALVNQDKALVDFAVNTFFLAILAVLEYSVFAVATGRLLHVWIVAAIGLAACGSYSIAISAARQWGNSVKSVFDLYRGDLLRQMDLKPPIDFYQERELWVQVSQAFLYWRVLDWPRTRATRESRSGRYTSMRKGVLRRRLKS